jgi:4-hydroxybenzoyl-CoA thioesterase
VANFVHRRQLTIEWAYCDPAGIVFNARFFELFDTGTWALLEAALGVPRHALAAAFDFLGVALVDAGARFIAPVPFGALVVLESQLGAVRRSSFEVEHRVLIDGELMAEGRETRVWAVWDKDNPGRLKAMPLPEEVVEKLRGG